jgi:hypothetical protein
MRAGTQSAACSKRNYEIVLHVGMVRRARWPFLTL